MHGNITGNLLDAQPLHLRQHSHIASHACFRLITTVGCAGIGHTHVVVAVAVKPT